MGMGTRRSCHGCTALSRPAQPQSPAIQKGARVLISLWDSLMFGRVPGTRPNISESHSKIVLSTRVPFCITRGAHGALVQDQNLEWNLLAVCTAGVTWEAGATNMREW